MKPAILIAMILAGCGLQMAQAEERDLAFEKKSMQWMQETKQADDAVKAGKLEDAARIYRTIISDRIQYNLDLSQERSSLAHVYEAMGKNNEAETLYKINIKTREGQDGAQGYTVEFPLNEYADFLDKNGRKDEAKAIRERANAIETAANKQGEELEKKEKQAQIKHVKKHSRVKK